MIGSAKSRSDFGHYVTNKDGDRVWVGSAVGELNLLRFENALLKHQLEEARKRLVAAGVRP